MNEVFTIGIKLISWLAFGSLAVYLIGRLFGAGFIRSILDHIKRKDKGNGETKQR